MNVFFKVFSHKGKRTLASPFWWARLEYRGKKRAIKLVRIAGRSPTSLRTADKGDAAFEKSRLLAEAKAASVIEDLASKQDQIALLRRIRELETGSKMASVGLADIFTRWLELPREALLSESYVSQVKSRIAKFVDFLRETSPEIQDMGHVTADICEKYMRMVEATGITAKTYNENLSALKTVFEALKTKGGMVENPFGGIPKRKRKKTVGRRAFSVDELSKILDAVSKPEHKFVRPILICGFCTAMRRGDCAMLKWESIDLEGNHIAVRTHKNDQDVSIPLFPLLGEAIRCQLPQRGPYVFPEQAIMYQENPDGISYRVELVLRDAGFSDSDLRLKREVGVRRASIRGIHAFRVTWATLALNAGVPIELVRKVTGHQNVEIVLSHYYKPARDDFRRALTDRMPNVFSLKEPKAALIKEDSWREEVASMTADNWEEVSKRLLSRKSE